MAWDPIWDDVYRSRSWGRYPGEDVVRFIMGHFGRRTDRASVRLLEVGCGGGANLWFMAREGFCVHGLERSPAAVEQSVARLDEECRGWREVGGDVRVGDLLSLPYPDAYFDAVIDVVAVCYSPFAQAQIAYQELARVTRPGGWLFSRTFAMGCWGDGEGEEIEPGLWACPQGPLSGLGGTRFTSSAEVPELCQGWRIERVERDSHTEGGGQHEIRHFQIHAIK